MNPTIAKYAASLSTYFGASLIPMMLNLVANPWIAKNMDPRDYAISGYYTSYSSLISPIIIFYLIHYYIKEYYRRTPEGREHLESVIAKATIWFSGIVTLVCFILLHLFLTHSRDLDFPVSPYLGLMVFALPLTGLLNLRLARFRMEKRATAYFRLSVANGLLGVAMMVLCVVWLKWGAFGKLLAPLVSNSCVFLFLLWKYRRILAIRTTLAEFRPIFIFCLPLALSAMLGYFTHGFSTTYVESIGETREYGIYVVGVSIGGYLTVFSSAINNTFQPDIYRTVIARQWRSYARYCLLQTGLITLVTILFILLAPWVISLLTAGRYVDSTPYAQIYSLTTITSSIYFLINNFSIATNRPRLYLWTSIIGSAAIVALMPVFTARWQYTGGAWMTVCSFIIFAIINLGLLAVTKNRSETPDLTK
ncbi:MAG: polysaccharide biosynthesis C-terminal domain-containing protein [Muribaculaceae bacterium]|nr:polysaccharide biosynthesis C-terminal domain-containing protein [Muribaculaceae bacterium]